jgi:sensor histidine kinase YesM
MFMGFPTRYSKRLSILIVALLTLVYQALEFGHTDHPNVLMAISTLYFLAILICVFKRLVFQKVFMFFALSLMVLSIQIFSKLFINLFIPDDDIHFLKVTSIVAMFLNLAYLGLGIKFGRQFLDKLFSSGDEVDWALYSLGALFAFLIWMAFLHSPSGLAFYIALWLFIPWNVGILCYSIISSHSKLQAQHERDMSSEILSSGRGYYEKLTGMTEHLNRLHHDYKHQLNSIQKMLATGRNEDAQEYLEKLNAATKESVIYDYCDNQVINALLSSFAERCEKEGISFSVKIALLPLETIDNYELCIIVGNLLENAVTASFRTPERRKRYIDLHMRPCDDNYGIKVENSYDGVLKHEGKELFSTKKGGGLGINSIKSVAKRHGGEYVPAWDDAKFAAFVLLKPGM